MITDKFSMAVHCFNPVHAEWGGSDEHIPVSIRGGLAFRPEKSISICAEILKSTSRAAVISAGCEYRYKEKFIFRMGVGSGTGGAQGCGHSHGAAVGHQG